MSENFRETFKAVLLAVLVVLFLPLVIICGIVMCRRSSGSGSDDGSADIRRAGESVGSAADGVGAASGDAADLADDAGELATAAGDAEKSAAELAGELHDAEELLVRLEHQPGTDLNRIERVRKLVAELKRRYRERSGQDPDT
ncbi:MAG: hypothetical protein IK091_05850 [Spirochaetales bacterium]|nr:hypothetical protein [Spirochaetales bacterium]